MNLGQHPLRNIREARGLTAAQLADLTERAGHRIPRGSIYKIEKGQRPLPRDAVAMLAQVLDLDEFQRADLEAAAAGRVPADQLSELRREVRGLAEQLTMIRGQLDMLVRLVLRDRGSQ